MVKKFRVKLPLLSSSAVSIWALEVKAVDINMVCWVGSDEFVPLKALITVGVDESIRNDTCAGGRRENTGDSVLTDIPVPAQY